jgi:(1->4)-alpha-D-glucan 1-alpha-D-glucosylmutase
MRFQQLSGPLMAKGFEDTTLYVYNRLLSLNDVGGDPDHFGVSVDEFHEFNRRRRERWPHTMNATATHDTKRGEDARARINVLSELPQEWERRLRSWSKINRAKKVRIRDFEAPDRNDEYFLYQTLIGSFPPDGWGDAALLERLKAYLIKAVREAKVHTEWLKPDVAYEEAFVNFAEAILAPSENNRFIGEFLPFVKKVAHCGLFNSLSQTLVKIVAPGVPDVYQGTESWDLSFVDPDNRRTVDYAERRRMLAELKSADSTDRNALLQDLLANWQDGRIKLYLLHKLLSFRRAHAEFFAEAEYTPLKSTTGPMDDRICAFSRHKGKFWIVAIVPRLVSEIVCNGKMPLGEVWGQQAMSLPVGAPVQWLDIISGQPIASPVNQLMLSDVFKYFPVSLLYHEESEHLSPTVEENIHAPATQPPG